MILSGLLVGLLVWFVAPPTTDQAYEAVGELPKTTMDQPQVMAREQISLRDFVTVPSQTDHFCYLPLNWCAVGLVGLGAIIMVGGLF